VVEQNCGTRKNNRYKCWEKIMNKNIKLLHETMAIIDAGKYSSSGEKSLKLSKTQMSEAIVLTDKQVEELVNNPPKLNVIKIGRCRFSAYNIDSFAGAIAISNDYFFKTDKTADGKILVLNFANPVEPGGGVYRGANAQEEDLCRKSTLLKSLESESANQYYRNHTLLPPTVFSDNMILSPNVEIIRDETNNLLEESVVVSVLTCAAPYVYGIYDVAETELEKIIFNRIMGILYLAVKFGYKYLVLGAWGCGAFGNDAQMMSRLFYKALKEIKCGENINVDSIFERVDFAVLDRSEQKHNLNCFKKYFDDFYRDEDEAIRQSTNHAMRGIATPDPAR
jgi:uncharacterized protein (TIGR02452 family)